ncbi:MAG: A/G-specific adenine glycosylase [Thermomicrobiales bacterium]
MNRKDPIEPGRLQRIRSGLLTWFRASARNLPWRRTRDPYRILVSEIMLQQTQVDRVIPYYERFLASFPNVEALAAAPTAEVIRLWSGLGYNRRAVNLQRAARAIVADHDGRFPETVAALEGLPGVGTYTAGAVAAFAFEQDVAFLDTNMRRVVGRVAFGDSTNDLPSPAHLLAAANQLVPKGNGWEWNQALIEFGALHCTARNPACVVCPLQQECRAFPIIQSSIAASRKPPQRSSPERFEESPRYFRGRIVEALRELPANDDVGLTLAELGPRVRPGFSSEDLPWLETLVSGLQRDGLAMVAEDEIEYDIAAPSGSAKRVRLPT